MSARSVAIVGASGLLGKPVLTALLEPATRSKFSQVLVLKRKTSATDHGLQKAVEGVVTRAYDENDLPAALEGVDVLVNLIGSRGHATKDAFLRALPKSSVKLYIPSEFGVDHDVHDFPHDEWGHKKHHAELARELLSATRMCRIFVGLFMEESIGPWFGFDTVNAKYEAVGSASKLVSYTSLNDVGKAVAAIAGMPLEDIPDRLHLASDSVNTQTLAQTMTEAGSSPIEITEVDLQKFKENALASKSADPSQYLRFLMGENKINHTASGIGNDNELINPGERLWKWKTMAEYANDTGGRPWSDYKQTS